MLSFWHTNFYSLRFFFASLGIIKKIINIIRFYFNKLLFFLLVFLQLQAELVICLLGPQNIIKLFCDTAPDGCSTLKYTVETLGSGKRHILVGICWHAGSTKVIPPHTSFFSGLESPGGSICLGHREQEWLRSGRLHHVHHGQRVGTQGRQERGALERTLPPGEGGGGGVWGLATSLPYSEPLHSEHRSPRTGPIQRLMIFSGFKVFVVGSSTSNSPGINRICNNSLCFLRVDL